MNHSPFHHLKQNRLLLLLTLVSCILVILLTNSTPQGVWPDPAWQLVALKQYLAGESPSLNIRMGILCEDFSKNYVMWTYWNPPGIQLAVCPFMKSGIALGDALRVTAIAALIIGSLGWIRWFSLFSLPLWIKIVLALSLPWISYVSNFLFWHSTEVFVYSSAPWILLATYRLSLIWNEEKPKFSIITASSLLGLALGFVYILKYTAVFASLGAAVYLGLILYQIHKNQPHSSIRRPLISFVLLLILFLIPIIGLSLLNYKFSHNFNLVTATYKFNLQFKNLIYLLGLPPLIMAGAEYLYRNLYCFFFKPEQNIITHTLWLGLFGLPAGGLLWWLLLRSSIFYKHKPTLLAITMFITNSAAMFLIWCISNQRFYEARYFIVGSMAVLPLVIQSGIGAFKNSNTKIIKMLLLLAFIGYIVMPLVYGYVSISKNILTRNNYTVGPSCIYNPSLAHHNLPAVLHKLMQDFNPATDVWYIPDPVSALDIPGRSFIALINVQDLSSLQKQNFLSTLPLRIHALIPAYCENNGKAQAIRASFVQAQGWSKKVLEDSDYVCWTTTLKVADKDKR